MHINILTCIGVILVQLTFDCQHRSFSINIPQIGYISCLLKRNQPTGVQEINTTTDDILVVL